MIQQGKLLLFLGIHCWKFCGTADIRFMLRAGEKGIAANVGFSLSGKVPGNPATFSLTKILQSSCRLKKKKTYWFIRQIFLKIFH